MFENFVFLNLLFVLIQQVLAFKEVTENNHVFVGHVFQQLYARDWFNCIQACHDEPRCVSYNYERSAGANGLCELNDCGVEDLCDRDKSLIYSVGFVFQQIRESKVSTTSVFSLINLKNSGVIFKIYPDYLREFLPTYSDQAGQWLFKKQKSLEICKPNRKKKHFSLVHLLPSMLHYL